MNDSRIKLGLIAAACLAVGSAVYWSALYRSASIRASAVARSGRLMLVVNGGTAPEQVLPPQPVQSRRSSRNGSRSRRGRSSPAPSPRTVRVRVHDNLSRIAARVLGHASRWREIAKVNGLSAPYYVHPGQVLRLPAPDR